MNVYPRVLLISHNAFSFSKNNGKTFNLLFKGWDPNSLAQLYFSNELPESSTCFNYYRITDMDIIDYVLGKFTMDETDVIHESILKAAEAAITIVKEGVDEAMAKFNT